MRLRECFTILRGKGEEARLEKYLSQYTPQTLLDYWRSRLWRLGKRCPINREVRWMMRKDHPDLVEREMRLQKLVRRLLPFRILGIFSLLWVGDCPDMTPTNKQ